MALAQPVSAPLTRAAIFLVVTINPGPDNRAAVRSFCVDLPALIRAVEFRQLEAGLSCVMGGPTHGTGCSGTHAQPNSTRSERSVVGHAMRFPRRGTCCSIYARSGWIFASKWRHRSWRALVTQSRLSTRSMAFV